MPPFRLTFLKIGKLGWQNQIEEINWRIEKRRHVASAHRCLQV